jgi:Zn-dependent protease with chaperone function
VTRRWLVALAAALAIPIIGWLMIFWVNAGLESQWRDALIAQYGSIPANAADKVTLAALCARPDFVATSAALCGDTQMLDALRWIGALAAASALLIVVVVGVVSAVAGRSRRRMAILYPTALKVVLVAAAALLLLQGALIVGVLWEAMQVGGRIWPWLLVVVAGTAVVGALGALGALQRMGQRRSVTAYGCAVSPEREPALFAEVEEVARKLDAEPPTTILVGFEPNFFVVDADVKALGTVHTGKTMFVSLPMAHLLTRDEFRAVIGHELGHFRGDDTLYTRQVAPLYGAAGDSLGGLANAQRRGIGIVTLPVVLMLRAVFGTLFGALGEMSRFRELEADRAGAQAASPFALASALVKLTRVANHWSPTFGGYVQGLATGQPVASVTADFLGRARSAGTGTSEISGGQLAHPFDTHPLTAVRLQMLGVPSADPDARNLTPKEPASSFFADPDALDAEIGDLLARRVHPAITPTVQRQFRGPSAPLRRAALDDRGIAAAIAMIGDARGPDITRPDRPGVEWVALTDLLLAPYTDELDFDWDVPEAQVPTGKPFMVVDVAKPGDRPSRVVAKGTQLQLVGGVSPLDGSDGIGEDVYAGPPDAPWAGGVVVVRAVGGGDVRMQAAGLFVTVVSDWLNTPDGPVGAEVQAAATAMLATRGTVAGTRPAQAPAS